MSLPAITTATISFSASGDNTVVAAVAGSAIWVWQIFWTVAGATNLTVKDGASTTLTGAMSFAANGAGFFGVSNQIPWFKTSRGNAFVINSSAGGQVSGAVYYSLF